MAQSNNETKTPTSSSVQLLAQNSSSPLLFQHSGVTSSNSLAPILLQPYPPQSIPPDFLRIMQENNLSDLGQDIGIIRNGQVNPLQDRDTNKRSRSQAILNSSYSSENSMVTPRDEVKRPRVLPRLNQSNDKVSKGLRAFSAQVAKKVEEKQRTSYNEVADELVAELQISADPGARGHDEKNIRRRVYDALNVLIAIKVISKDKKEIRWNGMPTSTQQDYESLEVERNKQAEEVRKKKMKVQDLFSQLLSYQSLIDFNKRREQNPAEVPEDPKIQLPFIVVHTRKDTVVMIEMDAEKREYFFNFSAPFEVHNDDEIIRHVGLPINATIPPRIANHLSNNVLQELISTAMASSDLSSLAQDQSMSISAPLSSVDRSSEPPPLLAPKDSPGETIHPSFPGSST